MEGPRTPRRDEFDPLIKFLDVGLSTQLTHPRSYSIREEYPTVLNPDNLFNMRIITDHGQIVSHAVTKSQIVKSPYLIYKVCTIGSVVTDPAFRRQGHSRSIINECLRSAHEQECDLAILWSDLHDFYERLGFTLAGTEIAVLIDHKVNLQVPPSHVPTSILNTSRVDPQALLRLYNEHSVTTLRSPAQVEAYLKIPNSEIFTLWDQENILQAYAIVGKGADLVDHIHEWGGKVSAIMSLIKHIRDVRQRELTLLVPQHALNLLRHLKSSQCPMHKGYLGLMKVTHPLQFVSKLQKLIGYFVKIEFHDENYILTHGTQTKILTEKDFLRLVFNPPLDQFSPQTPLEHMLLDLFPLPFWLWGWDSI